MAAESLQRTENLEHVVALDDEEMPAFRHVGVHPRWRRGLEVSAQFEMYCRNFAENVLE